MTDPTTILAHPNLPIEVLSMADVPSGWHVGMSLGEPGQYARESGDVMPTPVSAQALDRLRKVLGRDLHLAPRIGETRGFVCIVGKNGRLYEIQPFDLAVSHSTLSDWMTAVWFTTDPEAARRRATETITRATAALAERHAA